MIKKYLLLLFLITSFNVFSQTKRNYVLIMRTTGKMVLWTGDTINSYGFAQKLSENPPIPGVTITANEGDCVIVHTYNISQGPPHTIHWHGLDVNQANDGTPATSFEIRHAENAYYRFRVNHAGTYLYHCHFGDVVHVQMGMYGLVVVKPADGSNRAWTGGPSFDKSYNWLTSEIDKAWHDSVPFTAHHNDTSKHEMFTIPKYIPDYFLVNGKSQQMIKNDSSISIHAALNENIYIRSANIGYLQNRFIFPSSVHARLIDSDGRPLQSNISTDSIYVCPGERYGIMINSTGEINDSVAVEYINMNTHEVKATEYIHLDISLKNSLIKISTEKNISLYPNPSSGKVYIEGEISPNEKINIDIFDLHGKIILKTIVQNNSFVLPEKTSSGLYIVKIYNENFSMNRKIFID